jgi:hypothetical protein
MTARVVVIGGGVAGCATAVAATEAGARVTLLESRRHLGGVAVLGEHRTICGLAPIDASQPELLEPDLVGPWLSSIATGAPFRQGRVWLWPTAAAQLLGGLGRRLAVAGVEVRLGCPVAGLEAEGGRLVAVRTAADRLTATAVVDASGCGWCARFLGLGQAEAEQWPAHRSVLFLPALGATQAERLRSLATARSVTGSDMALALAPIGEGLWQLSQDVLPGTTAPQATVTAGRISTALGGELRTAAIAVAERDSGRPLGTMTLDELFSQGERGLCWAAWPAEDHRLDGVTWTWPRSDRYGLPEAITRIAGGPANLWCVGRGLPVSSRAASALRVIGTCLALGGAVGGRVVGTASQQD